MNYFRRGQKLLQYAFDSELSMTHVRFAVKLPINLQAITRSFGYNSFELWGKSVQSDNDSF